MAISVLWIAVRAFFALRNKKLIVKRELQLILVYICLIVVARFTFCPLRKVDGVIQPLLFDPANILPFRINLIPFVNLFDYDIFSETGQYFYEVRKNGEGSHDYGYANYCGDEAWSDFIEKYIER